jgi:DNA topoisomerase IB
VALRRDQEGLASTATARLRRSDLSVAGIRRRRCGRGFRYLGPDAVAITDPRTLARIRSLVIPPAWENVWICADPRGHIQAASYIDPCVIERYEAGHTIAAALGELGRDCHFGDLATRSRAEAAVVRLLARGH